MPAAVPRGPAQTRGSRTATLSVLAPVLLAAVCYLLFSTWQALGARPPAVHPAPLARVARGPVFRYTVMADDTLSTIATTFGVALKRLEVMNQLGDQASVQPGHTILIPLASLQTTDLPRFPDGTRALIEQTARRFGVDPSLALAIAWQESSGRANAVSSENAIGLMQVEPSTGQEVAAALRSPIDLRNDYDNVIAGVFWLKHLLTYYGGDEQQSVAAYYEGTANLARYGYLPDARSYTRSVLSFYLALKGR